MKNFAYMFKVKYLILGLFLLTAIGFTIWNWNHYPSPTEIDSFFQKYGSLPDDRQRINILKNFLKRLDNPANAAEDKSLEYFIKGLTQEFLRTENEAILIAVDETRIYAGFANYICGFYGDVKDTKVFKTRYKSNPAAKKALRRCAGISFSEAEIDEIEGGN